MNKVILLIIGMILFYSCSEPDEKKDYPVLKVSLESTAVSLDSVFSHLELIPLETNDSCLLIGIDKLICFEERFYVLDVQRPALYIFSKSGNFIQQISRKGNGPGEYNMIYDFYIDENERKIGLLSPYGYLLIYNLNGVFLEKRGLPVKPNYYSVSDMDAKSIALWSCVDKSEKGITVLEKDSFSIMNAFWNNDRIFDMGNMKPFYRYRGELYFTTAYQNIVYKLKQDSITPAYQWDFGKGGIHESLLQKYLDIENDSERNNRLLNDLSDGTFPFLMNSHNQNDMYYYVSLQKGLGNKRKYINVFYRKADGKSFVFEKTSEGMSLHPLTFTEDYIISAINVNECDSFKKYLSTEDYSILKSYTSEDNIFLVRFDFRK